MCPLLPKQTWSLEKLPTVVSRKFYGQNNSCSLDLVLIYVHLKELLPVCWDGLVHPNSIPETLICRAFS